MSRYEIEKQIHSCSVDKKLIEELEKYILNTVKDGVEDTESINKNIKLCLFDEYGSECLGSISDYHRDLFPIDTKKICLCYKDSNSKFGKIKITFGKDSFSSRIEIECIGDNSKEKSHGVLKAIESHINEFKNYNFLFHGFYEMISPLLFGPSFLGLIIFSISLYKNQPLGYFEIGGITLFIFSCIYFTLGRVSPFCEIDTTKSRKTNRAIKWFLNGLAGVLIFGVIAVFLRKKIFGI